MSFNESSFSDSTVSDEDDFEFSNNVGSLHFNLIIIIVCWQKIYPFKSNLILE